ncbi:MAG: D-alanyl-D-alanine carboxypeptidase family protein [Halorhodospira sp.]
MMRTILLRLLLPVLLSAGLLPTALADDGWGRPIVEAVPTPSPPGIGAPSHILVDIDSGYALAERDPEASWEPASLAKLMTAYVVFDELADGNIELEEEVTISEKAWRAEGSRMFLEVGSQVTIAELLQGVIVQSGNDAAVALAEHVAGDEATFAQVMNQHAERLGMEDTQYANATGMPDEQMRTTAKDTARLARAIIEDYPEYYDWYSQRSFEYAGIEQHNRNRLLWRDETVDGLKTGHTSSAGYNLVASAERGDMRLISVVLGTESESARAQQSLQLLNYGFRFFETHRLYSSGEPLTEARIWMGETQHLELGLEEDLYVTIPRQEYDNLTASVSAESKIEAPVSAGEQLGTLTLELADTTIHEEPLVAMEDADEGGLWRRTVDRLLLRFR